MFKSRKTILRGDFNIAPRAGDRVDMDKAKAIIRGNKDSLKRDAAKILARREEVRIAKWWSYRRRWKSYIVDGVLGKQNPNTRYIEFVDGGYASIKRDGTIKRTN